MNRLEFCFRNMNNNLEECIPFWGNHKEKIKGLINTVLEKKRETSNSLIIGAGNCFDIPLELICQSYEENVLLDIDEEALIRTKENCKDTIDNKIMIMNKEITGVNKSEADKLLGH